MALQITLVKTPQKASVSRKTHTFGDQGGTLGRGDSNTWVLPDPDKFLSSCHCEILGEASRYYIIDLSTNGTFLNGSPEPLGKGSRSPLNDGDTIEMGDYQFSVKLIAAQPFDNSAPFGAMPTTKSFAGDDIFGNSGSMQSSFADPFGGSGSIPDDFSLGPAMDETTDPLLAIDKMTKTSGLGGFGDDDIFSRDAALPFDDVSYGSTSRMDHTPSLDQAISWPNAKQENLIPDDWEDDLLGSSSKPVVKHAPTVQPPIQHAQPKQERPKTVQVSITELLETPLVDLVETPSIIDEPFVSPVEPVIPVQPVVVPTPVQPKPPTKVVPEALVKTGGQVDHRLINAMGLDVNRLSDEQINEISDMVGELMREIVDGMMQILRSRASIKNEFRMNVTTIQPVENNPLKFSVGVDEALENMFIKKTNAYKKPVEAFREGFQEIGEHQLAMIAGIRHGFERMMERFNPDTLERNFNKQGKGGGVIPGMQKAKYWTSYADYYAGFVDNMESSFQHLFGSDFVNAYEDQLRKLTAARKKNK